MSRCGKLRYFSREEALGVLAGIGVAPNRPAHRLERRTYVCWSCSQKARRPVWHLTSQSPTDPPKPAARP